MAHLNADRLSAIANLGARAHFVYSDPAVDKSGREFVADVRVAARSGRRFAGAMASAWLQSSDLARRR